MTGPTVALAGALDTKAAEYGFLRERLAGAGVGTLLLDIGVLSAPGIRADVSRADVAAAGGASIDSLRSAADRGLAMSAMGEGAARLVRDAFDRGDVHGVLVVGGSNAAFVMSRIAAALPLGCPKVLVSTIAAGDTRPYVGTSDLTLMYPVVDIAGLNSISVPVLAHAADAVAGMLTAPPVLAPHAGAAVGCSMFGVTTACVTAVHDELTEQGREVHTFHANGTGGRTLEAMIASGAFAGVADVTITELADELLGGVCSAGPERLTAAARHGVPQVIAPGALDMCNFGPLDTVPDNVADRQLYAYHPAVTLLRTSAAENAELARTVAERLASATASVEVVIPTQGFSQLSEAGGPLCVPEADQAFIDTLRAELRADIPVHLIDAPMNDPRVAHAIASRLSHALSTREGSTV